MTLALMYDDMKRLSQVKCIERVVDNGYSLVETKW